MMVLAIIYTVEAVHINTFAQQKERGDPDSAVAHFKKL